MKEHFCTIVTGNWIRRGLATLASIREQHPNASFSILFLCPPFSSSIPKWVNALWGDYVGLSDLETHMYSPYELSCAVRPRVAKRLLQAYDRVWLVDGDILFYSPLPSLPIESDVYLTPHICNPQAYLSGLGGYKLTADIINGIWNGGIIGYQKGALPFLDFQEQALQYHCHVSSNNTFFLDQHPWLSFAPFYCRVHTIQHPGVNVAFWNLHERKITKSGNTYLVNGEPLIAYHFSRFNPKNPVTPSDPVEARPYLEELGLQYYNSYSTRVEALGPPLPDLPQSYRKRLLWAYQCGILTKHTDLKRLPTLPRIPWSKRTFFPISRVYLSNRYPLSHKLLHPIQTLQRFIGTRTQ